MSVLPARFKPGQSVPAFATAQVNAGHFVKITDAPTGDGAYPVAHCTAGVRAFGVAENDSGPTTHDANSQTRLVNVNRSGIVRVVAGAAVAAAALVSSDSTGRAITATALSQSGTTPFAVTVGTVIEGQALTAADAAGDIIEVALF